MAGIGPSVYFNAPQREELEAVLRSECVGRNTNVGRLLVYLCQKHFEGSADQLKEYNIAVDVFGRSEDFDKRRDSIVRVEASRLRKKLKEYYEAEGSDHALRIDLPAGQYIPVFVSRDTDRDAAPPAGDAPAPETEKAARIPRFGLILGVAAALVLAIVGGIALMQPRSAPAARRDAPSTVQAAAPAASLPPGEEIRILCGYKRDVYVDRYGRVWLGDRYYKGGGDLDIDRGPIFRTLDPRLFQPMRTGAEFSYDIPLKPGTYELRLHWAETGVGPTTVSSENNRIMSVKLNGKPLFMTDVFASAGGARIAETQVFEDVHPAEDGFLHLEFGAVLGHPFVNGIEVVPGTPGKMRPVRIATRESAYADAQGRMWMPDSYVMGGRIQERELAVRNHPDADLFTSERYGNFNYAIPVPRYGRYSVRLRFAETYFKKEGERKFNVFCNGSTLLRHLDVVKEAGGPLIPIDKVFHGIQPNALGKIVLTFEPVWNYAMVNAIEVVQE